MGGGLMQLVAYGAQDIYLTGNPQITFFKVVYRRHTNFSMEAIAQTFSGSQAYGAKVTATISRNGDLVHKMYLEFNPNALFNGADPQALCANVGHTLINEVDLEIGGQRIDRHYGHWLQVWENLTTFNPAGQQTGLAGDPVDGRFANNDGGAQTFAATEPLAGQTMSQKMSFNYLGSDYADTLAVTRAPTNANIPLQFWFCRNPGLALPLIALQYHEVKVSVTFVSSAEQLVEDGTTLVAPNATLYVDYIYLDTDERRRFAQQSHEYLIEQLQFQQQGSASATTTDLRFNHPVKELIWSGVPETTNVAAANVCARASSATPGKLGASGNITTVIPTADTFCLKLNGHERFAPRHTHYFTRTQVHQHHTGYGGVTQPDSIAVYSFALKPEEHQPSGTCNFSRIDNAVMEHPAHAVQAANATNGGRNGGINFYAVNYNVLRVMSGMGGLAYSN
jgi:hypothetical protein